MSNTPDVPTDWEMWEGIESTLEKKRRNRFLPVLIAAPFLLAIAGVIGYLLAPKPDNTLAENVEVIRDTIYMTEAVHTVDTILQTQYITKWKFRDPDQKLAYQSQIQSLSNLNAKLDKSIDALDQKLNDYRYAFSDSPLKNDPKYKHLDFFKSKPSSNLKTEKMALNVDRSELKKFAISPLIDPEMLHYDRPKMMLAHNLYFENLVKNKKPKSLLDHIIPDYINIGASIETPGMAFVKNLSPGLEAGFGFNTELIFSPRFSLVTGIRSRSTNNKTTDEIIASLYPQPEITPDETFKNLSVKSTFIDIPLIFKYDILNRAQNNVYITAGLLMSKHNQTEYKYEYFRGATEIYYEQKSQALGWNLGSSVFGIGYEMDASSSTSAFVESYARYNFNTDSEAIHGLGFRFGMYYKI